MSIIFKPLQERTKMSESLLVKYPNRIPVILKHNTSIKRLSKYKFLVDGDMPISVFGITVKRYVENDIKYGMFLSCQGVIPPGNATLGELYRKYKAPDGFLYITIYLEHSFG